MRRGLSLLRVQLKAALLLSLQYRLDFFIQTFMALFWSASALIPLLVLFSMRPGVAGWSAAEATIVVGLFTALKGVLAGVIEPSLGAVVEHIRKGTLDLLLLKPVDAQFLLSTARLDLAQLTDVLAGGAIVAWGLAHARAQLAFVDLALAAGLVVNALIILYALWIAIISLAFRVVKVDNLSHLVTSIFEAARWPSSVFRGPLAFLFTFVIPLALMTTYPALALLGRATAAQVLTSCGVAALSLFVSRWIWLVAIRSYTGAGG